MIRAETELTISRDAAHVFSYFADLRNEPHWNRGHVRAVVMTTPDPIGLGTTFEGHHPGFGKATWRIAEFVPPTQITIEGRVGSGTYRYVGRLHSLQGATVFHGSVEWEPGGPLRVFDSLLTLVLNVQARRSFRNLRIELERAA
ncbi:MAG TPA: SRPBCC family protein [Anaerolineales bacterium]|nr:SRPBCC family protein [Anaerolineales bacterium]